MKCSRNNRHRCHDRSRPPWARRAHRQAQSGLTLIEVMISLLVVVVAMLALMRVTSVAVISNQNSQRFTQATAKAQSKLEALRNVPTATLDCLAAGTTPATCLSTCTSAGGELEACNHALALADGDATDSTNATYTYGYLVEVVNPQLYDIQVMVSFSDDSVEPPRTVRTIFRTAVYRRE